MERAFISEVFIAVREVGFTAESPFLAISFTRTTFPRFIYKKLSDETNNKKIVELLPHRC